MKALQTLASAFPVNYLAPKGVPVTLTVNGPTDLTADTVSDPFSIATALRCMQIIASAVAGCPLKAVNIDSRESVKVPALQARGYDPTAMEVIETATLHLVGWGNAYLRKWRNEAGLVVGLQPIHPSMVVVKYDQVAQQTGMPINKVFQLVDGTEVTEDEIMHIPGPSENGVTGISLITRAARTFEIARETENTARRLAFKGLRLGGILATDTAINEEQATNVQARWDEKTTGSENAGKVVVLGNGLKFNTIDMNPADAQFIESRKFSTTEIARLFGIPGWMINDQEKSTSWGSGQEQQFLSFITLTLKPYMQRIEQRVTQELLDYEVEKAEFKVEGLLRGDSKSRSAYYNAGILGGWLVPNEIRELEDLPDVEWGKDPYLPYNQSADTSAGGDTNASTE